MSKSPLRFCKANTMCKVASIVQNKKYKKEGARRRKMINAFMRPELLSIKNSIEESSKRGEYTYKYESPFYDRDHDDVWHLFSEKVIKRLKKYGYEVRYEDDHLFIRWFSLDV